MGEEEDQRKRGSTRGKRRKSHNIDCKEERISKGVASNRMMERRVMEDEEEQEDEDINIDDNDDKEEEKVMQKERKGDEEEINIQRRRKGYRKNKIQNERGEHVRDSEKGVRRRGRKGSSEKEGKSASGNILQERNPSISLEEKEEKENMMMKKKGVKGRGRKQN